MKKSSLYIGKNVKYLCAKNYFLKFLFYSKNNYVNMKFKNIICINFKGLIFNINMLSIMSLKNIFI